MIKYFSEYRLKTLTRQYPVFGFAPLFQQPLYDQGQNFPHGRCCFGADLQLETRARYGFNGRLFRISATGVRA